MSKRALCVGINSYPLGESAELQGCVNDAHAWARLLTANFGYDGVRVLIEKDATKKNILGSLKEMLQQSAAGDALVFTASAHGTYLAVGGRYEEALCPYDVSKSNLLLHRELRDVLDDRPPGVRLAVVIDAGHYGTYTRSIISQFRRNRMLSPNALGMSPPFDPGRLKQMQAEQPKPAKAGKDDVTLWACGPNQMCAETYIEDNFYGAMSYYAIETIREGGPKLTYTQLHKRLVSVLSAEGFPQTPRLEASPASGKRPVFT